MRIALIGKQFPDSLADNLAFTLQRMGHVVGAIDEDHFMGFRWIRNRWRRVHGVLEREPNLRHLRDSLVTRAVVGFRPDFVLNTFSDWSPEAVLEVRETLRRTVPVAFLYPDPTANLGREYALAGEYDAWFFKDRHNVELFRSRLGINAHYLPEACNPVWHCPVNLSMVDVSRYSCDLAIAGNMYYYRSRMLEPLAAYDMKIWGPDFPPWLRTPLRRQYTGEYVARGEKAKAFRATKIVVNTLTHKDVNSANARTFEAAGCGAFQLADWRPALEELFEPDKEIVLFQSRGDLKDKVDYYLSHPAARRRIADAGCRRAHSEHTYELRLRDLLRTVGLN